jgi:hypothetical protein
MTPEKKHFKSEEADSPEVTPLTEFLTAPSQKKVDNEAQKKVHNEDNEGVCDVWEFNKTSLTTGFGVYSIAEAWEWQSQLNRKPDNYDCVYSRLYWDLCSSSGMPAIFIPNKRYEHELRYSTKWYIFGFIAGFAAMVQHDAHITTPTYKNSDRVKMVFTSYPDNPVKVILPFGDKTHFVSVVWNRQHYTVLY